MDKKNEIILMTKFAVYDKNLGASDRKICEQFLSDYVYRKNFSARLFAFFGSLIVLFFYWGHKLTIKQVDLFSLNLQTVLIQSVMFVAIVMVIYTFISTQKAIAQYNDAARRLKNYLILLNRLDTSRKKA